MLGTPIRSGPLPHPTPPRSTTQHSLPSFAMRIIASKVTPIEPGPVEQGGAGKEEEDETTPSAATTASELREEQQGPISRAATWSTRIKQDEGGEFGDEKRRGAGKILGGQGGTHAVATLAESSDTSIAEVAQSKQGHRSDGEKGAEGAVESAGEVEELRSSESAEAKSRESEMDGNELIGLDEGRGLEGDDTSDESGSADGDRRDSKKVKQLFAEGGEISCVLKGFHGVKDGERAVISKSIARMRPKLEGLPEDAIAGEVIAHELMMDVLARDRDGRFKLIMRQYAGVKLSNSATARASVALQQARAVSAKVAEKRVAVLVGTLTAATDAIFSSSSTMSRTDGAEDLQVQDLQVRHPAREGHRGADASTVQAVKVAEEYTGQLDDLVGLSRV